MYMRPSTSDGRDIRASSWPVAARTQERAQGTRSPRSKLREHGPAIKNAIFCAKRTRTASRSSACRSRSALHSGVIQFAINGQSIRSNPEKRREIREIRETSSLRPNRIRGRRGRIDKRRAFVLRPGAARLRLGRGSWRAAMEPSPYGVTSRTPAKQ